MGSRSCSHGSRLTPHPRRLATAGIALVSVAIVLVLILVIGVWFAAYQQGQRNLTHRQREHSVTAAVARALATLAAHSLHAGLAEPTARGPLRDALAARFAEMQPVSDQPLLLAQERPALAGLLNRLSHPLARQGRLTWELFWSVRPTDFRPIGNRRFAREKAGVVRLRVRTTYRDVVDEFAFALRVRVTAAVLPGLSKFTLFVDDSSIPLAGGRETWRLNLVANDVDGNLMPGTRVAPLVLDHGVQLSRGEIRWEEFFRQGVGLVYLGGPPVCLNLARGESRRGEYGEGFQFFEVKDDGQWDGVQTTARWSDPKYGPIELRRYDHGVSADLTSEAGAEWWNFIASSPEAPLLKKSSVLRLFGTDPRPSPTLVLGPVYRSQITARGFMSENETLGFGEFFCYIKDLNVWADLLDPNPSLAANHGLPSIATMAREVLGLDDTAAGLARYQREHASRQTQAPYNAGLAYYATNNQTAEPFGHLDPKLASFCRVVADHPDLLVLPEEMQGLCSRPGRQLPNLQTWLDDSGIPGDRTTWEANPVDDRFEQLWSVCRQRGLLDRDGQLDLRGWLLVRNPSRLPLVIDRPLRLLSNGGIVLDRGDIRIAAPIDGGDDPGGPRILQVVTLAGNVVIETQSAPIAVSVVAGGRVGIRKGHGTRPTICGAMAMASLDLQTVMGGAMISYNPRLAAVPGWRDEERSLGIAVDPNPVVLP